MMNYSFQKNLQSKSNANLRFFFKRQMQLQNPIFFFQTNTCFVFNKSAQVNFSKANQIAKACRASAICGL